MDYEKKYKSLVEAVKTLKEANPSDEGIQNWVNDNVPELAESEDEKIRKWIIAYLENRVMNTSITDEKDNCLGAIRWLEKQGKSADKVEPKDYSSIDPHFFKTTDNVEPKFKNGQWIVWLGKFYKVNYNGCGYELVDQDGLSTSLEYETIDKNAHLWTIKEAQNGDVLAYNDGSLTIFSYRSGLDTGLYMSHVLLTDKIEVKQTCTISNVHPATKEQRKLLSKKMHEAGYEWDAEKKELRKIEQIQAIDYSDSLPKDNWELIREFVNKFGRMPKDEDELNVLIEYVLRRQKPTLSKEDEEKLNRVISLFHALQEHFEIDNELKTWLKSLKDRVQPQLKQEWSEEDVRNMQNIDSVLFYDKNLPEDTCMRLRNWLKSLKPQNKWKPSDEQMEALNAINVTGCISYSGQGQKLINLYNDLKNLK